MNPQYAQFANSKLWKAIDKAIADLEKNRDMKLTTNRELVIGYLCKGIAKIKPSPKSKLRSSAR
jgi:hypothetical protein